MEFAQYDRLVVIDFNDDSPQVTLMTKQARAMDRCLPRYVLCILASVEAWEPLNTTDDFNYIQSFQWEYQVC